MSLSDDPAAERSLVLKIVFAGTPEFARLALARIAAAGHEVALVLTQPDRPAGRGMKLQASAVKQFALEYHIPIEQPRSLRLEGKYPDDARAAQQAIAAARADVMVVAAYGLILPQWVLESSLCLNIHGSLLPRWRGAAPIHRAIEAGDAETGVTIMRMDAGLDTGDMVMKQSLAILDTDTTGTLHDRVAALGAEMIVQALQQVEAGRLEPVRQPDAGVTYANKIEKQEAAIDWHQSAALITRRVRAFNPFPGATATLNGEVLKVWEASPRAAHAENANFGEIVAVAPEYIDVAAMNSVVRITQLQRPGGKRLAVADFVRGFDVRAGMCMTAASA